MKKYRLLRNNKESGPFTAAEVIEMGLKPYDLIWADGKSAAWRYPGEMEEFKAYAPMVEEQPFDRFYKKEVAAAAENSSSTTVAKPAVAKEKPRIRIRAEWNKIGTSAAAQVVAEMPAAPVTMDRPVEKPAMRQPVAEEKPAAQVKNAAQPSWESSWLDWQQEQNAVNRAAKTAAVKEAAAVTTASTAIADEPVLETKFSQSLNDIKEKYAETVLKAKTRSVEWHKYKSIAILGLLAIPVLAFGIYVGQKWSASGTGKDAAVKSIIPPAQVSKVEETDPAVDNTQPDGDEQKPAEPKNNGKEMIPQFDDNGKAAAKQKAAKKLGKTHYLPIIPNGTVVKKDNRQQVAPVVKKQQQQQPVQQERYAFTNPANVDPSGRNKVVNPAILNQHNNPYPNNQQAKKGDDDDNNGDDDNGSPVFSHTSKKQKIADFVKVDAEIANTQMVQNLHLNVENLSDFRLDLVVIDVEYFGANNRFKSGQTVYIKNIPASETMNVKVPDNPNATRIRYKVSLVSAEQKGVYLIGE